MHVHFINEVSGFIVKVKGQTHTDPALSGALAHAVLELCRNELGTHQIFCRLSLHSLPSAGTRLS